MYLLAQTSLDSRIDSALGLIQKILILPSVCLVVYGAWAISEGKVRDGVLAIVGGFLLGAAIPIAKALFAV